MSRYEDERRYGRKIAIVVSAVIGTVAAGYGACRGCAEIEDKRNIEPAKVEVTESVGFWGKKVRFDYPAAYPFGYLVNRVDDRNGAFSYDNGDTEVGLIVDDPCDRTVRKVCQDVGGRFADVNCREPTDQPSSRELFSTAQAKLDEMCAELDCDDICNTWRRVRGDQTDRDFQDRL
jgi:hypothetical protein